MSIAVAESVEPSPPTPDVVFSGKGTLLVGLLVGLLSFHFQLVVSLVMVMFQIATGGQRQLSSLLQNIESNGSMVSIALVAGSVATTGTIVACVRLRTPQAGQYLGLTRVSVWALIASLAAIVAFAQGMDYAVEWFGVDSRSDVMVRAYTQATWKPLFWFALIVGAPVYEEVFMRGFLFAGWRKCLGTAGAIVVISFIWTFMHLQYGPVQWVMIFTMGIVLGYARAWTGSLYAPIAMHALNNAIATMQLMRQASEAVL